MSETLLGTGPDTPLESATDDEHDDDHDRVVHEKRQTRIHYRDPLMNAHGENPVTIGLLLRRYASLEKLPNGIGRIVGTFTFLPLRIDLT